MSTPDPAGLLARASAALARGDALGALSSVAGQEDPHALALRAIALAQLEEPADALLLLDRAAASFDERGDALSAARARAARAEVLASERELGQALGELDRALAELEAHGDARNAAWTRLVRARLSVLVGDLPRAREELALADEAARECGDPTLAAAAALARGEALARSLAARAAAEELARAEECARAAGNEVLRREVEAQLAGLSAWRGRLEEPAASTERPLDAFELEALLAGPHLVVDALRRRLHVPSAAGSAAREVDLARKGALFELLLELARAFPSGVPEARLVERLFGAAEVDGSHRARLETEVARLRQALEPAPAVLAEGRAFRLATGSRGAPLVVTAADGRGATGLEALLWDGAAWSARALAAASGLSLRTVQRRLGELVDAGRARALGGSRSLRYARVDPALGFAPRMFVVGLGGWTA